MSAEKRENMWLNIGFNIAAPSLLLIKGRRFAEIIFGSIPQGADVWIFILALAFPLAYGVYDLASRRKWNIFSIIGLASVLLTGGIGLLKLSPQAMVIKETAVPLVMGVAILITAFTKRPLAKILLLNESVLDVKKIDAALDSNGCRAEFDKSLLWGTYILAASFIASAVLNFLLASYIFHSPAGTPEFNEEVGKMTALSFPVIVIPTTIIFIFAMVKIFSAITKLTGLKLEDILPAQASKK